MRIRGGASGPDQHVISVGSEGVVDAALPAGAVTKLPRRRIRNHAWQLTFSRRAFPPARSRVSSAQGASPVLRVSLRVAARACHRSSKAARMAVMSKNGH